MKNIIVLGLKYRIFSIFIHKQRLNLLKYFFVGAWGGLFLFLLSCDSGFQASKLAQNYVTISSPSSINRANMSSYSLNGTCFYNEQPVTVHIKGQTGDPLSSPNLATCTNKKWSVDNLNLSDLSDGNVIVEVVHLNPSGKGYSAKEVVMKNSEGAAVSINKNIPHITYGAANIYTLTGTCTEFGDKVNVEVSDGTNISRPSFPPPCQDPDLQDSSSLGEWSTNFDHSNLSEGSLTVTVTHSSASISDTTEILKDVTPPSITIANTAGERVSTGTYTLSGTCSEIDKDVNVTLIDSQEPPRKIPVAATCTNNSGSGQWEVVDLDISFLSDGDISILAIQKDEVENEGEDTLSITKGSAVVGPVEPVVGSGCEDTDFRGTGTFNEPYIVCNAVLLNKVRDETATGLVIYKLEQDIDLGGAVFEPLGAAEANCGETGAFTYVFNGNEKRIVNYKMPMSREDYYHPTDRRQDIFGRCVNQVSDLTVNPGSDRQLEFCDLFDLGSDGGYVGLTQAEEQVDGSLALGPRILCSPSQIHAIDGNVNNLSWDYILYKDMDFKNVESSESIINGGYTGTFDGNNKTIRNLVINSSDLSVGFFSQVQPGGIVKNLKFDNVNVKSTNNEGVLANPLYVGVLAGKVKESFIINCSVTDSDSERDIFYEGSSSGVAVGGLVGYGLGLELEDSFSESLHIEIESSDSTSVTGSYLSVGGLVGYQIVCRDSCSSVANSITVGHIKRSYTAYQDIRIKSPISRSGIGGLVGSVTAGQANPLQNKPFKIKDSYTWENSLFSISSNEVIHYIGGLAGQLVDASPDYSDYSGDLEIVNSYSSGGNVSVEKAYMGGLLGVHRSDASKTSKVIIENSFSNMPFVNFEEESNQTLDSSIGGLSGANIAGRQDFKDFSESYYTGQIFCFPYYRRDSCGGIAGRPLGVYGTGEEDNFTVENLYSTAKIYQYALYDHRSDYIGLLFSEKVPLVQVKPNIATLDKLLNVLGPATNVADNPSLYFLRNGIVTVKGVLPGTPQPLQGQDASIKSDDQPCFVFTETTSDACLGLAVDPEDSITAGNRSLTPTQFQNVPSDPSVATGTSPALGNEFLYTEGWCPRVCRDGFSSCTEASNTLVGFDENGDPLPGPGGGLKAQARNEGRNCFEPCFEFEDSTISAYRCKMNNIKIPEGTTSILADVFKDKSLTSVTFPSSLTSIGDESFLGNDFKKIVIPSGVISIGDNTFSNNSSLTSVCIETQESNIALGTTPFGDLASLSISYESDGDCSD